MMEPCNKVGSFEYNMDLIQEVVYRVHNSVSSCHHKSVPNWSQKRLPNATQMQSLWPLGRANKLAKFCYLYVFKNERK
jgi:hypothetical protein